MNLFTPSVMKSSFEIKLDVAFLAFPTVTKPYLLNTTIPAWLSGAFFISLYMRPESMSGALSRGMKILSSIKFFSFIYLTSLGFFK